MIAERASRCGRGELFTLSHFKNQVPWFGPYINDGRHYVIASSALKSWPRSVRFDLTGWVFDEGGNIIAEKVLRRRGEAGRPITVNFKEEFGGLNARLGMAAMLLHPADDIDLPWSSETWATRLINGAGVSDIVATEVTRAINFPEKSGRRLTFRKYSGALTLDEDWRSVSLLMNASANPDYSTALRLRLVAFNERGESVEAPPVTLQPFGTVWLDLLELFGQDLRALLERQGGRGAYVITADEGGCISYQLLYNPATGQIACDHSRPLMAYIPKCYGAGRYTLTKPSLRDYLAHGRFVLGFEAHKFRDSRGR